MCHPFIDAAMPGIIPTSGGHCPIPPYISCLVAQSESGRNSSPIGHYKIQYEERLTISFMLNMKNKQQNLQNMLQQ